MTRGEIYRSKERIQERGDKADFYVIVSRSFIARSPEVTTVVCAPVYSSYLGLSTEVPVGTAEGLPHDSSIRADFLTLLSKRRLTGFVGTLSAAKLDSLDRALTIALELSSP